MIRRTWVLPLLFLGSWPLAIRAQSPVPIGEETVVAEEIGRSASPPRVAVDSAGRFLVVWEDASSPLGNRIRARRLAPDGEPLDDELLVAFQSSVDQKRPSVSALADERFVVVWTRESDSDPPSVAARLFSADGAPEGPAFQVNQQPMAGDRSSSDVATLTSGDFVVAWRDAQDYDGPDDPTQDLFAQRFSAEGVRLGSEIEITSGLTRRNDDVTMASTPNGGFVVAWKSLEYYGYYSATSRVFARTFDADGQSSSEILQVNDDTDRSNSPSSIAVDENGDFLVVWSRFGPLGDPPPSEARGRMVSADGAVQGEELLFSTDGSRPAAAADPNGNFLVTWADSTIAPSSGLEIVAQRWSSSGQPLSNVEILNESALGLQFSPTIATDPGGNTLVVWKEQLDERFDLSSRRFATPCRTDEDTLCLASERFRVELDWRDFAGGSGRGRRVPVVSDDSGLLWFFEADNWEMLVKVLDGCSFNGHYWVFAAATTDVEHTLRVTDTETRQMKTYHNDLGNAAPALTDTLAFAACP